MDTAGFALVDKPAGLTSHDVVARLRRVFQTRKTGHAGTLDPMATGLLVVGVNAATRLLTFVVGAEKTYTATIRLGQTSTTDDAEGEISVGSDASSIAPATLSGAIAQLTGKIEQVPSAVSAIKIAGRRAYDRVRAGEEVIIPARSVTVSRFDCLRTQAQDQILDVDVIVECSSGTYVRALARDLGNILGVGGHLTVLRRSKVGPFDVSDALTLDQWIAAESPFAQVLSPVAVASSILGTIDLSEAEAADLRVGKPLRGQGHRASGGQRAAVFNSSDLVGVVRPRGEDLVTVVNMPEERQ